MVPEIPIKIGNCKNNMAGSLAFFQTVRHVLEGRRIFQIIYNSILMKWDISINEYFFKIKKKVASSSLYKKLIFLFIVQLW